MAKKHSHNKASGFNDPQKGFDSTTKRIVGLVAILIAVVMAGTYFFITYKYGSFSNMFLGETTVAATKETTTMAEIKDINGSENILISLNSAGESNVYALFLAHFDMSANKTVVTAVPTFTVDTTGKTLEKEYALGGVTQVKYSLEKLLGIKIDHYTSATQNGYKYMLNELGNGVEYTIPEDIQFTTTDFSMSLQKGKQELSFDYFMKVLRFTQWPGNDNETYNQQANLILSARKQLFTGKNVKRDVERFSKLTTYIKTDISAENYAGSLDKVQYIASVKYTSSVVVPQGEFSGVDDSRTFKYSASSITAIKSAFK